MVFGKIFPPKLPTTDEVFVLIRISEIGRVQRLISDRTEVRPVRVTKSSIKETVFRSIGALNTLLAVAFTKISSDANGQLSLI